MKNKITILLMAIVLLIQVSPFAFSQEGGDLEIFGLEIEKFLNLGSGILATGLFAITLMAYKRTRRKRLVFVSSAFLLFALKGFLQSHELFIEELLWIDPTASFLNFAILLSFYFGLIRK